MGVGLVERGAFSVGEHWECGGALRSTICSGEPRLSKAGDRVILPFRCGIELVQYDISLSSQAFHISM